MDLLGARTVKEGSLCISRANCNASRLDRELEFHYGVGIGTTLPTRSRIALCSNLSRSFSRQYTHSCYYQEYRLTRIGLRKKKHTHQGFEGKAVCVREPISKPYIQEKTDGGTSTSGHLKGNPGCCTVPDMWTTLAQDYGDVVALDDPHREVPVKLTYRELKEQIEEFAEGLHQLGLNSKDTVSLFSDNSSRWLVADQGVMSVGAVDAVRGAKASPVELAQIAMMSDSVALIVETAELLYSLLPLLEEVAGASRLRFAVVLWDKADSKSREGGEGGAPDNSAASFPVKAFDEVIAAGRERKRAGLCRPKPKSSTDDMATIVYTSGTTGIPKGVMLTHRNLLHQVTHLGSVIPVCAGERVLSLLPPWHMYERSAEYFCLSRAATMSYSTVTSFKEDLVSCAPDYFVAVPLVFDLLCSGVRQRLAALKPAPLARAAATLLSASMAMMDARRVAQGRDLSVAAPGQEMPDRVACAIQWLSAVLLSAALLPLHLLARVMLYKKVRAALGIRKVAVSGGGSLPLHVDKLFEALEITLLNGYGLTETSPVLACRRPADNVLGSVGLPVPETEIRVVALGTGEVLAPGHKGRVEVRGPQVMRGYHKNAAETARVLNAEGFFDTGDLGWIVPSFPYGPARGCGGMLVLQGRAKDTIVLSNGENVEPQALEELLLQSSLISQVMLVGQDQRRLGALVVPDDKALRERAAAVKGEALAGGNRIGTLSQEQQPLQPTYLSSLPLSQEEVLAIIRSEISNIHSRNGLLRASTQAIGPVALVKEPFSVDNGLLTPTMKLKRNLIAARYATVIERMFKANRP